MSGKGSISGSDTRRAEGSFLTRPGSDRGKPPRRDRSERSGRSLGNRFWPQPDTVRALRRGRGLLCAAASRRSGARLSRWTSSRRAVAQFGSADSISRNRGVSGVGDSRSQLLRCRRRKCSRAHVCRSCARRASASRDSSSPDDIWRAERCDPHAGQSEGAARGARRDGKGRRAEAYFRREQRDAKDTSY